jgi:hypothetical protein
VHGGEVGSVVVPHLPSTLCSYTKNRCCLQSTSDHCIFTSLRAMGGCLWVVVAQAAVRSYRVALQLSLLCINRVSGWCQVSLSQRADANALPCLI